MMMMMRPRGDVATIHIHSLKKTDYLEYVTAGRFGGDPRGLRMVSGLDRRGATTIAAVRAPGRSRGIPILVVTVGQMIDLLLGLGTDTEMREELEEPGMARAATNRSGGK